MTLPCMKYQLSRMFWNSGSPTVLNYIYTVHSIFTVAWMFNELLFHPVVQGMSSIILFLSNLRVYLFVVDWHHMLLKCVRLTWTDNASSQRLTTPLNHVPGVISMDFRLFVTNRSKRPCISTRLQICSKRHLWVEVLLTNWQLIPK